MPRYFLDIFANDERTTDGNGLDLDTMEGVRAVAMRTLPAIARDEVAKDGDRQAYSVLVTDGHGTPFIPRH